MGISSLLGIRSHLKTFPDAYGVTASSDPTMLFSGLLWGTEIAVRSNLLSALWDLKPALFQCGDRYLELVINRLGMSAFREDYLKNRSDAAFYQFGPNLEVSEGQSDLEGWRSGTHACIEKLGRLSPEQADQILRTWVEATNLALESVFFMDDWAAAWERRDGTLLQDIANAEEEHKNVRVVTTLVNGANALSKQRPYTSQEESIISRCSRWFTLIDDKLDLKADIETAQPNHLAARLIVEDEFEKWQSEQPTPKTDTWYQTQFAQARAGFVESFPVWPRVFRFMIERKAKKAGQSPF